MVCRTAVAILLLFTARANASTMPVQPVRIAASQHRTTALKGPAQQAGPGCCSPDCQQRRGMQQHSGRLQPTSAASHSTAAHAANRTHRTVIRYCMGFRPRAASVHLMHATNIEITQSAVVRRHLRCTQIAIQEHAQQHQASSDG